MIMSKYLYRLVYREINMTKSTKYFNADYFDKKIHN